MKNFLWGFWFGALTLFVCGPKVTGVLLLAIGGAFLINAILVLVELWRQ